jgi:hypothetical protein
VPLSFGADGKSCTIFLKDGGPLDEDGKADGTITDPGALYVSASASPDSSSSGGGGGGGGCFITASHTGGYSLFSALLASILILLSGSWLRIRSNH